MNQQLKDQFEDFNYYLQEKGVNPITESEFMDIGFTGDDSEKDEDIQQHAIDYMSELHTELCEARNSHRYEY